MRMVILSTEMDALRIVRLRKDGYANKKYVEQYAVMDFSFLK